MARYDYLNNYLNSNMNTYKGGGMFTSYNVGGTHETNPNGGIPLGEDATVEQGETSVNLDQQGTPVEKPTGSKYIFSDRQVWTPEDVKMAGLPAIRKPVTAGEYMAKLNEKFSDRAGSKPDKETLDAFTKRATQLAEQKRMQKEQLDRAMQLNSQQVAPENTEIPEGMEEYVEQPEQFFGGGWSNYFGSQANAIDTSAIKSPAMPTSLTGGASDAAGEATSGTLSGAGSYIKAAGTAFDLYNTAKSGNTSTNKWKAMGAGAIEGASAGAAFGPWGAGAGALAGIASGYIGSMNAEKNEAEEQRKAIAQVNAGMPNSAAWTGVAAAPRGVVSAYGGFVGNYAGGGIIDPKKRRIANESTYVKRPKEMQLPHEYVQDEGRKARAFLSQWMKSPMYNKMVKESDPSFYKELTNARKRNLFNSSISYNYDNKDKNLLGSSNSETGEIKINPSAIKHKGTIVHEESHSSDRPSKIPLPYEYAQRLIPQKDRDLMQFYLLNNNDDGVYKGADVDLINYISDPSETRARLNTIRKQAKELKIYDPFTEEVDSSILRKLKKAPVDIKKASPIEELNAVYKDDQLIKLLNKVSDISKINKDNIAAYGGFYSDGGIHIKPENRGKFNATKERTGKTTEELTHSSNPLTRKRAIFAQNAAKWHHVDGGLMYPKGGFVNPFPAVKSTAEVLTGRTIPGTRETITPRPTTINDLYRTYHRISDPKVDSLATNDIIDWHDKSIKLKQGERSRNVEVDLNVIDAIDDAERRHGLKRGDLSSIVKRERNFRSAGNNNRYNNLQEMTNYHRGRDEISGIEPLRYLADRKVPGVNVIKTKMGLEFERADDSMINKYLADNPEKALEYEKLLKKSVPNIGKKNTLDLIAQSMKKYKNREDFLKAYNPGDPNYVSMVNKDREELLKEKEYNQYLDRRNKKRFDVGGPFKPSWLEDPYLQPDAALGRYPGEGTLSDEDFTKSLVSQYTPTTTPETPSFDINKYLNKAGDIAGKGANWLNENKNSIMRAYPIISNIIEKDKIRKPIGHYGARLNDAYDVPMPDEARAMRDINTAYNNRYRAIGQMGGSQAQQRAAMLGIGAQQNQAISQTQQGLDELRMNRAMQEAQFKNSIAQYNAAKSDQDIDINDRNMAKYDELKSKFTAQIAGDIGQFGLEQDRMDQVANMYGYDRKGKYLVNRQTGKIATPEEISKMRTAVLEEAKKTAVAFGGYITRKPSKY